MALIPDNEKHLLQIQAGALGRKKGHSFEQEIANYINLNKLGEINDEKLKNNIIIGNPAEVLINYIKKSENISEISSLTAICTGILATSENKKKELKIDGKIIDKSKSDLILIIYHNNKKKIIGVSTKQCNNKTPTNAQLYFTTAKGFSDLLRRNGMNVPDFAEMSLKQFCGEKGFNPIDDRVQNREIDPRRYFWEEINTDGKEFWEKILNENQKKISEILFKFAYEGDNFIPQYLLHKTKKSDSFITSENAIYNIDELIQKSMNYKKFYKKTYRVNKGSYKESENIIHEAPRFGIIQMQRGGQKQHPTQLQFNLEAGYFYKI